MKKFQKKWTKKYKAQYNKEWAKKNRDKANNYSRNWNAANRERSREIQKNFRISNPKAHKRIAKRARLKLFGLTLETYIKMKERYEGRCWACRRWPTGRWKSLNVDHCHKLMKVRGLLCNSCNLALGLLQDSPKRLLALMRYLKCAYKMGKRRA